ncbi:Neutral/alkaline non-lysosomal ceramidase-domain-containing protein [Mycena olivaceomarginata]|nr:Neutral/alkaline non-lysosomal ceramidase-domain-containing protein [Mycena olivaceomarginata]
MGLRAARRLGAHQARTAGAIVRVGTGKGDYVCVAEWDEGEDLSGGDGIIFCGWNYVRLPAPFCAFSPTRFSDGPGAFNFVQGNNKTSQNPFWELVKVFMTPSPSEEQVACQYPKPILLNTWSPSTVDVQIFRVAKSFFGASPKLEIRMLTGSSVMLIIPGELTTMAGRRISEAIQAELISSEILGDVAHVVVAGTANMYVHYIATREEYTVQRYEGASTLYEPYTLEAIRRDVSL